MSYSLDASIAKWYVRRTCPVRKDRYVDTHTAIIEQYGVVDRSAPALPDQIPARTTAEGLGKEGKAGRPFDHGRLVWLR